MEQSLEIFNKLVSELLADEAQNPVAEYIPSRQLYERLDLKLQKDGISALELEKSLKDLVFHNAAHGNQRFFQPAFWWPPGKGNPR